MPIICSRAWRLPAAAGLLLLACLPPAATDPIYIFGMHEPGGESHMIDKGKPGWVLTLAEVGHNPADTSGADWRSLSNQGLGVICRINHGYGTNGTIPYQKHYADFAQRCGNFVQNSYGCHIWIIGNEGNLSREWPSYEGTEEVITPAHYVTCFQQVRANIRSRPGHGNDEVIPQPSGTWAALAETGDWLVYWTDILNALGEGNFEGLAVHTYTHGTDPNLIFSDAKMDPPYQNRYYNFRAYRDYLNALPSWARDLPVYITETDENGPWADTNSGWVKNAYSEINNWNSDSAHQKIRAVCLYRWPPHDEYYIGGDTPKWGVINDWRDAMGNDYRWATQTARTLSQPAWHLISLPRDPADPSPAAIFSGISINANLFRWNASTKAYVGYYTASPTSFGDCQTAAGYWLRLDAAATVSYYGVDYTLDQRISLASAGWQLVGHPFTSSVSLSRCSLRNNTTGVTKTLAQAKDAGWIELPMYDYDSAAGSYRRCGFESWDSSQSLNPWRGYWLRVKTANLTLTIPAP